MVWQRVFSVGILVSVFSLRHRYEPGSSRIASGFEVHCSYKDLLPYRGLAANRGIYYIGIIFTYSLPTTSKLLVGTGGSGLRRGRFLS